ncbi:galaxin-2-like, partial [Argonauta hians]
VECCGSKAYDLQKKKCLKNRILFLNQSICNNAVYHPTQDHCCDDVLIGQSLQPGYSCCGVNFILDTEVCCNGKRRMKEENKTCCGQALMQNTHYICCEGKIWLNEDDKKCCGQNLIDVSDSCCVDQPYDASLHFCDQGKLVLKNQTIEVCNDNLYYYAAVELCCHNTYVIKKQHEDQDSCCQRHLRPGVPYNSKEQTCERGELKSKVRCGPSENLKNFTCCNGWRYRIPSEDSICCDDKAERKLVETLPFQCQPSLCSNKTYDQTDYICCNNNLIKRDEKFCWNGRVYKLYNFIDGLYNKNIFICGDFVVKKDGNADCCLGMPYYADSEECPFKWRDHENQIKMNSYSFWDIILCKTDRMDGNITRVVSNSQNTFTVYFKNLRTTYKVAVHITDASFKKKLMKANNLKANNLKANNLKAKKIIVFYEKILGNKIILGEYGSITLAKNPFRQTVSRHKCDRIDEKIYGLLIKTK